MLHSGGRAHYLRHHIKAHHMHNRRGLKVFYKKAYPTFLQQAQRLRKDDVFRAELPTIHAPWKSLLYPTPQSCSPLQSSRL